MILPGRWWLGNLEGFSMPASRLIPHGLIRLTLFSPIAVNYCKVLALMQMLVAKEG
jgi:hypothetical protein